MCVPGETTKTIVVDPFTHRLQQLCRAKRKTLTQRETRTVWRSHCRPVPSTTNYSMKVKVSRRATKWKLDLCITSAFRVWINSLSSLTPSTCSTLWLGLWLSTHAQRTGNSTPTLVLPFLWIWSRPAEQQLNLQTALNYLIHRGTSQYTDGQVTWHQSQEVSRILQMESLSGRRRTFDDKTPDEMSFCPQNAVQLQ